MSLPIEGMRDETRVDGRTKEARATRTGLRSDAERPDMRADMRPDSVREAETYAQQILENLDGSEDTGGETNLSASLAPEGWIYELKAESVVGMENRHHMLGLYRKGWRPVAASRHPWLMPKDHEGPIVIKGLILCEKPKILVDREREAEKREAIDQLRNSEARLQEAPPNTAPRGHPNMPIEVKHDIMRPLDAESRRRTDQE